MRKRLIQAQLALFLTALLFGAPCAAAQWMTMESSFFVIHYPAELEDLARRMLAQAEARRADVEGRVGHSLDRPAHIIIDDSIDLVNAFVVTTGFHPNIFVYPAFPLPGDGYLSGLVARTADWWDLLFTHEYTHVLHADMARGTAATIRGLFGRVPLLSTPIALAPPMFVESYAIIQESWIEGWGRGGSPYYDMFLRQAAASRRLPTLSQVLGFYPLDDWIPGAGPYLYGYAFFQFITERYGYETWDAMNEVMASAPELIGRAVREATGRSVAAVWDDFEIWLVRRYDEQMQALLAEPLVEPSRVEQPGRFALTPVFLPTPGSSAEVAYAAAGDGADEIRVYDLERGSYRRAASADAASSGRLAPHPSGDRLIYARIDFYRGGFYSDLYEVDLRTGRQRRLTRGERAVAPVFDPSGERLAYIRRRADRTELVVREMADGDVRTLFAPQDGRQVLGADWSPDGRHLALAIWSPGGQTGLYLMPAEGGEPEPLTRAHALHQNPAWSPDGRYILFDSDRSGVFNLYAYDLQDGSLWQLTHTAGGIFAPSVSPDGALIAAMSFTIDGYDLSFLPWEEALWRRVEGPYVEPPADYEPPPRVETSAPVPYRASRTMAPAYWMPVFQEWLGESQIGLVTGGGDVRRTSVYGVSVVQGVSSGRIEYDLQAARVLGDRLIVQAGHGRSYESRNQRLYTVHRSRADVEYHLPSATGSTSLGGEFTYATRQQAAGGPITVSQEAEGRLSRTVSFGRGLWTGQRHYQLSAGLANGDPQNAWATVRWHQQLQTRRRHAVRLETAVGAAAPRRLLKLGGEGNTFSIRGWPAGSLQGRLAAKLTLETRHRIGKVQNGLGDQPIFFGDFDLRPFVDIGAAAMDAGRPMEIRGGAGVEIGLDIYLAYGNGMLDARLGFVQPFGADKSFRAYFTLGL